MRMCEVGQLWVSREGDRERNRMMARQCVGLHVINQSLVILCIVDYSDLFVRLHQMLSFS